jgi:P27 family predicted phage terminase small subunit
VARAAWDELVPLLALRRTVTRIDKLALARYCVMFAHWREAQEFVARHGKTYAVKDDEGKLKIIRRNPYTDIAAESSRQLGRLEAEFGMTPASRPRVPVSIDDGDDSLARFIAEGRRNSHAG